MTCSHCPPGCRTCEPDGCECYSHQDWPDTRFDPALAVRLARCIDAPGCDGRSHGLECNNALYAPCPDWCNWANPNHWHDHTANGMPVDLPTPPTTDAKEAL